MEALEEKERRASRNKISTYFSTPAERAKYPKQIAFFKAGAIHNERLLAGGNRCLVPSTTITTEFGERQLWELAERDEFEVLSWVDGEIQTAESTGVFFKGIEPAYRIGVDNGEYFECSGRHRVLTTNGWRSIDAFRRDGVKWQLVGGNMLTSVQDLGPQPIVDFEVPGPHNYIAGGAVHHNSGKTLAGNYELTLHLTGKYPKWWEGRRFDRPIVAWLASDTAKTSRDVPQAMLLGQPGQTAAFGTGMIPADSIARTTVKHGLADAVETVEVKHVSGGLSMCQFKSTEQGRETFQGAVVDLMFWDEEPPEGVYTEGLLRTMTVNGISYICATPLRGLTEVMLAFMPEFAPQVQE